MSAARILNVLTGVKSTGHGRYLAKCPAHEDRSPSLSIRELDDGRILLHCFGGCGTDDVLGALGLTLSALFPERPGEFGPVRSRIPASDILTAVANEIDTAALILARAVDHHHIEESDWERLAQAARIVGGAAHG
jgi:hypothetical protein